MTVDSVGSYSEVDEEELRVRALQALASSFPPVPLPPVTPIGLKGISSLGAAEAVEVPRHRPILPAPRHMLEDVVKAHLKTEQLNLKGAQLFEREVSRGLKEIDELELQKTAALAQEAKAVQSRNTWTILGNVSQYIVGASGLVLGYTALSLSPVGGALLMASGGLGLTNRVLHDTPLLNSMISWYTKSEDLQTRIAHQIDTGLFYMQLGIAGMNLTGSVLALQAGAWTALQGANGHAFLEKAQTIMGAANSVSSVGSRVGMAFSEKKVADLRARLKELTGQMTNEQHMMYEHSANMNQTIDGSQAQVETIRKAIHTLESSQEID